MTWVLDERYDKAIEELKDFLERPTEYPNFKGKITRYIHHSIDLIYAIKAKRGFPGINSLTRAKQQELREKFKEHFKELQYILKIVEKTHGDLRIQDARSTIYVVRALWLAALGVIILGFWLDIVNGLAQTSIVVFDDLFTKLANSLAGMLGL
jgi:acetylornithine deacetylase/succinyl-diaminopimelate desuccinylase-like protein